MIVLAYFWFISTSLLDAKKLEINICHIFVLFPVWEMNGKILDTCNVMIFTCLPLNSVSFAIIVSVEWRKFGCNDFL